LSGISELNAPDEVLSAALKEVVCPRQPGKRSLWEMLRFSVVGIANTLIDLLTLNLLVWRYPTHNAGFLLVYSSISFLMAALNSFLWNKYWTFKKGQVVSFGEVARFALVTVTGFLCNDALVWLVGGMLHPLVANPFLWANLAKLSATGGTMIITYFGMRLWVFAGEPQTSMKRPQV